MTDHIVPYQTQLQAAIKARLDLLEAVSAYIRAHWDDPTLDDNLIRYSRYLVGDNFEGIRSIQYLVNGRITFSWPIDGNEAALGQDLLNDPRHAGEVRTVIADTMPYVFGPTELYQGGRGLIARRRVPLPAEASSVIAAVVLDFSNLIRSTGLDRQADVQWRLLNAEGAVIHNGAWSETLPTDHPPVSVPITLGARSWQLEANPRGGWDAGMATQQAPVRIAAAAWVAMLTLLAWALAYRRRSRLDEARRDLVRRADEKFQLLFDLVPDGVVLARAADARILEVNETYCQIFRRPREAMIGRTMHEVGLIATAAEQDAALSDLEAAGAHSEMPFTIRLPDGTGREGMYSSVKAFVDDTPCFLSVVRDVHDRVRFERKLAESQRLEAIGQLAGGIAHDFNNIITGITGYATLAQQGLDDGDPRVADLVEIGRAARRAATITRQLLTFAKRQVTSPEIVDIRMLVRQAEGFLRQLTGETIRVEISLPPTAACTTIDPAQFEQVLTNLTINGHQAMPHGGTLRIQVTTTEKQVVLTVTDSGTGIPEDVLPHIFEPFYTTKAQGVGTGLGLAMVRGIVEGASGRIEVHSEVGIGSTFRIFFPLVDAPTDAAPSEPTSTEFRMGSGLILLVEDEPQVRTLTTRVLTHLGYEVLSAEDGTEALALAAAHHGPIDLVLTDMMMPRMGGGELVNRLRELRPELPVLLMSGYSEELVRAEHPEHPFLAKPFTPDELAAAIRKVLEAR